LLLSPLPLFSFNSFSVFHPISLLRLRFLRLLLAGGTNFPSAIACLSVSNLYTSVQSVFHYCITE
jgi:hypothetical protein